MFCRYAVANSKGYWLRISRYTGYLPAYSKTRMWNSPFSVIQCTAIAVPKKRLHAVFDNTMQRRIRVKRRLVAVST